MSRAIPPLAATAAAAAFILLLRTSGRTLELPGEAGTLLRWATASRDAADLRRWAAAAGITTIRAATMAEPRGPWTPEASEALVQFWRTSTEPMEPRGEARTFRVRAYPRPPRALGPDEPPGQEGLAAEGDALLASGRAREALAAYERARRQAPAFPGLVKRTGDCQARLGQWGEAWKAYERAATLGGPDAHLYEAMGDMFAAAKRPDQAEEAYHRAAGLDPGNTSRWAKLAEARLGTGNAASAREAAQEALRLDPACAAAARVMRRTEGLR